jgi:peroxiredoxin
MLLDVVRVRQRTNPPVHARELEDVVLKDDTGRDVCLGDLWSERPVVLAFLRHYGCVFCRDQAVQLHRARKAFEDAGVGVAVVGFGTPADAAEFRRLQGVDLRLLVDSPERRTYVLAGAKVATFDELLGPKVAWTAVKRTVLSRLRLGSIAVHQGKIRHHAAQLGGVLLIAPDGSVRYSYLSQDAADNPPLREVIAAARAIRPRVKAPPGPEVTASPEAAAHPERSPVRA